MAILIVDQPKARTGTILPDRVLIGRRSMNHLVLEHNAVSRMHAWIDRRAEGYVITDMRSRTGTRINGLPLARSHVLSDGDEIEIGPAKLTFHTADRIPLDIATFELPRHPIMSARDAGIRFDCPSCRAPMWAAAQFASTAGTCVYCNSTFTVPAESAPPPPPPEPPKIPRPTALPGPAQIAAWDNRLETLQVKAEAPPVVADVDFPALPAAQPKPRPPKRATDLPAERPVPLMPVEPAALAVEPLPAAVQATTAPAVQAVVSPEPPIAPVVARTSPVKLAPTRPAAPARPPTATKPASAKAPVKAAPARPSPAKPAAPAAKCGVCHSPILPGEAKTSCPSCKLVFHEECWQENYGCSAYGCPQVNILKPPEPEAPPEAEAAAAEQAVANDPDLDPPKTPWAYFLLGLSALGAVASAVSFGGASAVMLLVCLIFLIRTRKDPERKTGPLIGAILLSLAGIAGGAIVSMILFRMMK